MAARLLTAQLLALSGAALLALSAVAATPHTTASAEPATWKACHRSDVRALRFIRVGQATLWRQSCTDEDLLSPPLRLEFRYFREVPGDAFAKAADNFLQRNLDDAAYQALEARLAEFNSHYQDIDDGDSYTLTSRPDGTLQLALNNRQLTLQQGDDFARAYMTIWFGEQPYSRQLKRNLLGN